MCIRDRVVTYHYSSGTEEGSPVDRGMFPESGANPVFRELSAVLQQVGLPKELMPQYAMEPHVSPQHLSAGMANQVWANQLQQAPGGMGTMPEHLIPEHKREAKQYGDKDVSPWNVLHHLPDAFFAMRTGGKRGRSSDVSAIHHKIEQHNQEYGLGLTPEQMDMVAKMPVAQFLFGRPFSGAFKKLYQDTLSHYGMDEDAIQTQFGHFGEHQRQQGSSRPHTARRVAGMVRAAGKDAPLRDARIGTTSTYTDFQPNAREMMEGIARKISGTHGHTLYQPDWDIETPKQRYGSGAQIGNFGAYHHVEPHIFERGRFAEPANMIPTAAAPIPAPQAPQAPQYPERMRMHPDVRAQRAERFAMGPEELQRRMNVQRRQQFGEEFDPITDERARQLSAGFHPQQTSFDIDTGSLLRAQMDMQTKLGVN